ncbi:MAG: glycogen synthase GlgA [Planctomycetales bacterium]|nr:glycogen synthase GlgA [Planctomycetales bacterium]
MRIVLASSEAVPWSKTGGLADVSTALAKSLAAVGHDVTLVVPYHRQTEFVRDHKEEIHNSGVQLRIPVGTKTVLGTVFWTHVPSSNLRVLLIDQPEYFDRAGLYQSPSGDYSDNCERFVFFSRAVVSTIEHLVLRPHIVHANDWQTGLAPALIELEKRGAPGFEDTRSIFTIHNLAFQGWFPADAMKLTGLDWKHFNWQQMECHNQLNLLKTGIAFADFLTTVSPTYAKEIQTPEFGCGLHELLEHRRDDLVGILNGVDTDTWCPESDPFLPSNFNADNFAANKPICKSHLQDRLGLPDRPDAPLFGMVSRMTDQKGLDLITEVAQKLVEQNLQIAFLGTGNERYEWMLRELARKHPDKVSTTIGFDERLAHQIEAGSDFYLMPSRYEPCGLNQMYSLAYGTVPLVRAVGGLADSVVDTNVDSIANGTATGIVFRKYDGGTFFDAVSRCLKLYQDPTNHHKVIRAGMRYDSTWSRSANEYLATYENTLKRRPRTSLATRVTESKDHVAP